MKLTEVNTLTKIRSVNTIMTLPFPYHAAVPLIVLLQRHLPLIWKLVTHPLRAFYVKHWQDTDVYGVNMPLTELILCAGLGRFRKKKQGPCPVSVHCLEGRRKTVARRNCHEFTLFSFRISVTDMMEVVTSVDADLLKLQRNHGNTQKENAIEMTWGWFFPPQDVGYWKKVGENKRQTDREGKREMDGCGGITWRWCVHFWVNSWSVTYKKLHDTL